MNFYEHHIGDYQKKTAHLSIAEHGVYFLMMQIFYATEKPLPTGKVLYRMLRAETKAERAAVDLVVREFWKRTNEGLTNRRASRVLSEYYAFLERQRTSGKKGAIKRWGNGHSDPNGETIATPSPQNGDPIGDPNGEPYGQTIARGVAKTWPPTPHSPLPTSHNKNPKSEKPLETGFERRKSKEIAAGLPGVTELVEQLKS